MSSFLFGHELNFDRKQRLLRHTLRAWTLIFLTHLQNKALSAASSLPRKSYASYVPNFGLFYRIKPTVLGKTLLSTTCPRLRVFLAVATSLSSAIYPSFRPSKMLSLLCLTISTHTEVAFEGSHIPAMT